MTLARFPLGQIVTTPGALKALTEAGAHPLRSFGGMLSATGASSMPKTAQKTNALWSMVSGSSPPTRCRMVREFG